MTGRRSGRRREQCYTVEVGGRPIRVRGARPLTAADRAALTEVVAAIDRYFAERPEEAAEMARKQTAALERIRNRNARIRKDRA